MKYCDVIFFRFFLIIIGLIGIFLCGNSYAQTTVPVANQAVNISRVSSSPKSGLHNTDAFSSKNDSDNNSVENQKIKVPERYKKGLKGKDKSSADNKGGNVGFGNSSLFTSTTVALVFVIILIFAIAWIFRKAWPGGRTLFGSIPFVNILGRTSLSPKQSIVAIKVGGRIILLGVTEHHISKIVSIEDAEEVSKFLSYIEQNRSSSISSTFRNLFKSETMDLQTEASELLEGDLSGSERNFSKTSDKIEENDVLNLKNEINMLLNKVEKLKGIGGRD